MQCRSFPYSLWSVSGWWHDAQVSHNLITPFAVPKIGPVIGMTEWNSLCRLPRQPGFEGVCGISQRQRNYFASGEFRLTPRNRQVRMVQVHALSVVQRFSDFEPKKGKKDWPPVPERRLAASWRGRPDSNWQPTD